MKRKTHTSTPLPKGEDVEQPVPVADEMPVLKPIDPVEVKKDTMKVLSSKVIIGVYVALALLGIGTGYLVSRSGVTGGAATISLPGTTNTAKVVGSNDTKTFKDSAEGVIQRGGFENEGTHQLIREGGPSQTAYLLSSVVDLDQYVGKKVKVWGQTIAAQKVAWLMDVGKVELQQ